jgi:hypothetical protein
MNKLDVLKKLSVLRKHRLFEIIGVLPSDLCNRLIKYANESNNEVLDSLSNRYNHAPRGQGETEDSADIKDNYIQVFLNKELTTEVEKILKIQTTGLRVAVMKPNFCIDWHVDFDLGLRLHCDLNIPSEFSFRIRNDIQQLDKITGHVYKINVAHYHKVSNESKLNRYSLIGLLDSL